MRALRMVAALSLVLGLAVLGPVSGAIAAPNGNSVSATTRVAGPVPRGALHGDNACSVTADTMSFSPALRRNGNGNSAYVTLILRLRKCTRAAAPSGAFTTGTPYRLAGDSCRSLFAAPPKGTAVGGNILWNPRTANRSTDVQFNRRSATVGPPVHFRLFRGTASGGSFDGSAKSGFSLTQTYPQIKSACRSRHGLTQVTVKSGSFKVGPSY